MKKSISFILSLIFLVSCGKDGSNGPVLESNPAPAEKDVVKEDGAIYTNSLVYKISRTTALESDWSNLESFKKNINSYRVQARTLTGHFSDSQLICEKILFDQRKNTQRTWFDSRGEGATLLLEILTDDPSEIIFECYASSDGKKEETTRFVIPKSFVITKEMTFISSGIGDAKKIATLLLDKDSSLSFEGRDVNLEMNELISAGGEITTYSTENLKVLKQNANGESGGVLNLKINEAKGEVKFLMKGRHGGVVTNIRTQKQAPAADAALNGTCNPNRQYDARTSACMGKRGGKGFDGEPGYDGFAGGNSGKLNLEITKKENLKLSVKFLPGIGSEPTPDTKPTAGQPGGVGNYITWYESDDCGNRGNGPRGVKSGSLGSDLNVQNLNDQSYMTGRGVATVASPTCRTTYHHQFPNGAQGPAGSPVPPELQAKKGQDGNIETATVRFIEEDNLFEINNEWKNF